jgi:hypothetical protein
MEQSIFHAWKELRYHHRLSGPLGSLSIRFYIKIIVGFECDRKRKEKSVKNPTAYPSLAMRILVCSNWMATHWKFKDNGHGLLNEDPFGS